MGFARQKAEGVVPFHGWVLVEIFTDNGLVGIGNAALAPQVTKQVIDLYLKPLLIGMPGVDAVFAVVFLTVVLQGWALAPLLRRAGLRAG